MGLLQKNKAENMSELTVVCKCVTNTITLTNNNIVIYYLPCCEIILVTLGGVIQNLTTFETWKGKQLFSTVFH